jgi:hypothetical protein
MVECYLCKGKLRVTRDKHVFDEKLKKRYHFKCFAGICRVCDMPVYTKSKHKVIGSNVWHEKCYKTKHRHNPATEEGVNKKLRQLSEELGKLKIGRHPGKKGAATEEGVTRKLHQLADELDKMHLGRKNPTLVTPELETDIIGAFKRVIHGMGTEADKALVRMAREADVVMSTGPSVLLKRNPEECDLVENPEKLDYIIQDEFGTTFETGKGTEEQAEARALHYNQKHMRQFKVIYPKRESPEVKKAAQTAAKEMLKS